MIDERDTDLAAEIMVAGWQQYGTEMENQTQCLVLAALVASRKEGFVVSHLKELMGEQRFKRTVKIAIPVFLVLVAIRTVMFWMALEHIAK